MSTDPLSDEGLGMSTRETSRATRTPTWVAVMAASLPTLLGLLVLAGWYMHNETLIQVSPAFVPMQYNTALGFLACGAGLLFAIVSVDIGTRICGTLTTAIGILTLAEYVFALNLGIDQLLMEHYIDVKTSHPGRMAPNTALCFSLAGAGLLLSRSGRIHPRTLFTIGALGSLTFGLGMIAFAGYAMSLETAYGWGKLTRMAVHTAAGFVVLGIGMIAYAWSKEILAPRALPRWFPVAVGIGVMTITLSLWQSLGADQATGIAQDLILAFGIGFAVALSVSVNLTEVSRQSEMRVHTILNTVVDAIITIDKGGTIQAFNRAAEKTFGHQAEDVLGQNVKILMPEPDRSGHDGYLDNYLTTGHAKIIGSGRKVIGLRKDGTTFPIELAVTEMHLGRQRMFVGSCRDITEQVMAEAQVIEASKLATLGEMATAVAHQLNQPLNVIRLAAGNALRQLDRGEEEPGYLRHKLKRIANQTRRAATIIDHMRMFGREAGKTPILLDPSEAILGALDLVGEQLRLAGIEIVPDFPESCRPVLGHRLQLEQVFLNLLINARDAIWENPADAESTITLAVDDTGADVVRISVTDTGGGVPKNALSRVFEPFYTTKEMGKGTGLGLSVSYGIIRDMGGSIDVENVEGGARFRIILPVAEEAAEALTPEA